MNATREICKLCWRVNRVGFHVPDDVWLSVVPAHVREHVVCLDCFTRLADEAGLPWDLDIQFFPVSARTRDWRAPRNENEAEAEEFSPPLDAGVREYVLALRLHGFDTYESCEGGPGHAFNLPTVRFHGGPGEGHRAWGIMRAMRFPVAELNRVWDVDDGELVGPHWQMTFWRKGATRGNAHNRSLPK